MSIRLKLVILAGVLAAAWGYGELRYHAGWYAHSEKVNRDAEARKAKAQQKIHDLENRAATASAEARVVYQTVYRDVVKYVNNPNHPLCRFDGNAVRLRQRAIDAANNIPGFDEPAVQNQ
ncbi:TPA: hypothetical protein ACM5NV_004428 [Escherichia coli]|nr:hypothetical protein [Escherichia coli]